MFWPGNASAVIYYITIDNRSSLGAVTTARPIMWPARAAKSEKAPQETLAPPRICHMPTSAHARRASPVGGTRGVWLDARTQVLGGLCQRPHERPIHRQGAQFLQNRRCLHL